MFRSARVLAIAALASASAAGCAKPAAQIAVQRPPLHARPVVDVPMQSQWASWSSDAAGRRKLLLLFPLPGSRAGRAAYALFLHIPASDSEYQVALPDGPSDCQAVFAHLSRVRGQLDGACYAERGSVQAAPDRRGRLAGQFTLFCPDEITLTGRFVANSDDGLIAGFERDYLGQAGNQARLAAARAPRPEAGGVGDDLLAPLFVAPAGPIPPGADDDRPMVIFDPTSQPED